MATITQLFGGYQENKHGTPEGYGPEQGVDVGGLAAGTLVRLPEDAYYVPGDSSNYQSVFQSARTGYGLSFTHIDPIAFASGTLVKAGTVIGVISSKIGWPVPGTTGPDRYYSSGPHLEAGVYYTPQAAANWQYNQSIDPVAYYSGETMALATSATQPYSPNNANNQLSAQQQNPPPSNTPPINNVPVVGGVWQFVSSPFSSIGSSLSDTGHTLAMYQQVGDDFTSSFDKIIRWMPAAFIIIVIGFAYGKAKHG